MTTQPTYHPLLAAAPVVRAILDGRQTQDRRPILIRQGHSRVLPQYAGFFEEDGSLYVEDHYGDTRSIADFAPWQPGDILYVRETWRVAAWRSDEWKVACDYKASPEETHTPWIYLPHGTYDEVEHRQLQELQSLGVEPDNDGHYRWEHGKAPVKWRPSIHMPRWAARIFLEVVSVRAERLQDISEEDAIAEGIQKSIGGMWCGAPHKAHGAPRQHNSAREAFADLWNSLYSNRPGQDWSANPWVWATTFNRVQP
ncbi:MAG: hypothetical protein DELT_02580 [Desulfovibrio sp.]